jgi:hypothetical protein
VTDIERSKFAFPQNITDVVDAALKKTGAGYPDLLRDLFKYLSNLAERGVKPNREARPGSSSSLSDLLRFKVLARKTRLFAETLGWIFHHTPSPKSFLLVAEDGAYCAHPKRRPSTIGDMRPMTRTAGKIRA